MNLDLGALNPLLGQIKFPINRDSLVQALQQQGASNQVISMVQQLPDKTFNSPQDIQTALSGLGNLGGNIKL